MNQFTISILQPDPNDMISGGYVYNHRLAQELRNRVDCRLVQLGKDFPNPSDESLAQCDAWLQNAPSGQIVAIDSLILGTIPELLKKYKNKFTFIGLIHLPLQLNFYLNNQFKDTIRKREKESLHLMDRIVVTSSYIRDFLINQGINRTHIIIIEPGTDKSDVIRNYPSKPENLLCVSNILPMKKQKDIILALSGLKKYPWQLSLCGDTSIEPFYFSELVKIIEEQELKERISFTGRVEHKQLAKYYAQADLLIHASEFETYGMVLTEAMSYKLPVITTNAGGIPQTIPNDVAIFFEPGNIQQLQDSLEKLFEDTEMYQKMAHAYDKLKFQLPSWKDSASVFYELIKSLE